MCRTRATDEVWIEDPETDAEKITDLDNEKGALVGRRFEMLLYTAADKSCTLLGADGKITSSRRTTWKDRSCRLSLTANG